MKRLIFSLVLLVPLFLFGQIGAIHGSISGDIVASSNNEPIAGATIILFAGEEATPVATRITDEAGHFFVDFSKPGIYRLTVTAIGFATFTVDSLHVRPERQSFKIPVIRLLPASAGLSTVVVYAEKPLYENKDGKLTFNAGESALSEGSSATELLKQTPLITVDEDGKVLMKGKEVKILVDDKPVNMDAAQLQSMLESMPGSMIEKIEVLTTPPPQYATERGGVINIVTKKGKTGNSGRINASYGSRGEAALSAAYNMRMKKFSLNSTAGISYSDYSSERRSDRQNLYIDSVNYFKTFSDIGNSRWRPFLKASADVTINSLQSLTITGFINVNNNDGENFTRYQNINRFENIYKQSTRSIANSADVYSNAITMAYQRKWTNPNQLLRIDGGYSTSDNKSSRNFYQAFLAPDSSATGLDSTQEQLTRLNSKNLSLNVNYDQPLYKSKLFLNVGGSASHSISENNLLTSFLLKPDNKFVLNELLSNHFFFYEDVLNVRASLRYKWTEDLFGYAGMQLDHTAISFNIDNNDDHYRNRYFSGLPFANMTYRWKTGYSITASYKRSITRPGINQLNPSVDYSDPYNTRFGNPYLLPYFADNTDLTGSYWNKKFSVNISAGYNVLSQVYSTIRTLQPDGKTVTTWQNIGGRQEYETNLWGNWNAGKKLKLTASAGYAYNVYSSQSKLLRRYKDGGSITGTFNGNYVFDKLMNFSASVNYNRLANPQGSIRTAVNTNLAIQRKFFSRLLSVTLQLTDPWGNQQLYSYTSAVNYSLKSYATNNTQNVKLSAGYTIRKKPVKKPVKKKV